MRRKGSPEQAGKPILEMRACECLSIRQIADDIRDGRGLKREIRSGRRDSQKFGGPRELLYAKINRWPAGIYTMRWVGWVGRRTSDLRAS